MRVRQRGDAVNSRIRSDGCYSVFPVPSENIFIWRDPTARPVLIIFVLLSLFIWERLESLSKASTDEQDISRREGNAVKLRAALQGGRGDRGGRRQRGYRFARLASEIERDIEEMATRSDGVFGEVYLSAGTQAVLLQRVSADTRTLDVLWIPFRNISGFFASSELMPP